MDAAAQEMQVRRDQLRAWISAHHANTRAFCIAHNLNESEISQLLRTKSFGSRRARNLEATVGMPLRYLEGVMKREGTPVATPPSRTPSSPHTEWPFRLASYDDFLHLSPEKRHELDVRVSEFIAGAIQKKRTA
ncbi:MAG: hypothetical protein E2591_21230 [Achromobacter sp.]|jgi:hypothetical protein|uniref:hypothetical protein n=1 Tax=Achromobacter sp. TaxID=134375 RepID=UPI0012CD9259|nr:hypothetical protein [Achromobacter sp.]MPS80600.1 hypothetical protein [Achromobacter sp.]CAB3819070.1 hypothetical protein LMG2828_00359 [Achromobacter piechaudii]